MEEYSIDVAQEEKYRPTAVGIGWKADLVQGQGRALYFVEEPKLPQRILKRTLINPTIELFNMRFNVRREAEGIYITSEQWPSLSAFGNSFQEAFSNLVSILNDCVREYVMVPEDQLSEDALDFRNLLISKLF
jgi:hypothetical protein